MVFLHLLLIYTSMLVSTVICAQSSNLQDPHLIKRKKIAGHYIPELHGAHLGRYVHDDSGRYYHIHIPYDGGYGDRGLKYIHDLRGHITRQPYSSSADDFSFGPDDHIRLSIEFNFNGTGWQIVDFEWIRDTDEKIRYNLLSSNQLWGSDANIQVDDDDIIEEESFDFNGEQEEKGPGLEVEEEESNGNDSAPETPLLTEVSEDGVEDDDGEDVGGQAEMPPITTNQEQNFQKASPSGYIYQPSGRTHPTTPQYKENVRSALSRFIEYIQTYIVPNL